MANIFTTPPPQPDTIKPGQLTPEQVEAFFRDGFVQIDKFFDPVKDIDPCLEPIEEMVDELVAKHLYKGGYITNTHDDKDVFHRLTCLNEEFSGASVFVHKTKTLPKAFQNLWTNDRLINIMEQLIGSDDIGGHPVWNLRPKTPSNILHDVPWHQDVAYMSEEAGGVLQITCWIPFLDTNAENGCLQVVKGGHRAGKVSPHYGCWKDTWYIWTEGKDLEEHLGCDMENKIVTCEVPKGGILLFSNMLPHRSVPNTSDKIRWSIDVRFQDATKPAYFFGIKNPLLFRSKNNPNHIIQWDEWNNVDRRLLQAKLIGRDVKQDEYDFINYGPWMLRWPIINENKHTAAVRGKV